MVGCGEIRNRYNDIEMVSYQCLIGNDQTEREFFEDCDLRDSIHLDRLRSVSTNSMYKKKYDLLLSNLEDSMPQRYKRHNLFR